MPLQEPLENAALLVRVDEPQAVLAKGAGGHKQCGAACDLRLVKDYGGGDRGGSNDDDRRRLVKPMLHYVKKNQENPSGALLWLESPIHVSNVMKADKYDARKSSKR